MITIESVTGIDQLSVIRQLALKIWPPTYRSILSDEQSDYMIEMMYSIDSLDHQLTSGHIFFLLYNDSVPSGFLSLEHNYPAESVTKIHKIYILPECQGLGFGKILLNHAEKIATQNQQYAMVLNVNKYNKAINFYLHNGYDIEKEEVIDIGRGFIMDDYVMKKLL